MIRILTLLALVAITLTPARAEAQFRFSSNVSTFGGGGGGGGGCIGNVGGFSFQQQLAPLVVAREIVAQPVLVPCLNTGSFNVGGYGGFSRGFGGYDFGGVGGFSRGVGGYDFGGFDRGRSVNVDVLNRGLFSRGRGLNLDLALALGRGRGLNVDLSIGRRGGLGSLGLGGGLNLVGIRSLGLSAETLRFRPSVDVDIRSGLLGRRSTRILVD